MSRNYPNEFRTRINNMAFSFSKRKLVLKMGKEEYNISKEEAIQLEDALRTDDIAVAWQMATDGRPTLEVLATMYNDV